LNPSGLESGYSAYLALLLADPSPCLRWLVMTELLDRPDEDAEVQELAAMREHDPLVANLFRTQAEDGSWAADGLIWQGSRLRATWLALMRLGYLGFGRNGVQGQEHPAVRRGAMFLFGQQHEDGAWPLPGRVDEHGGPRAREGYSMVPLQTALPLRALAACGYATDARAEQAYDWLLAQRLADGAWPTGRASGVYGYVAGYRRLAHSRWGCRSNTTGSLICLALHPDRQQSAQARRALDLLLGRETRERQPLGFEVARLVGGEPVRGFFTFYARFDLALVLDLCWRIGASLQDERVADLAAYVWSEQGSYGIWEYVPRPQASRWITFDLLRSLSRLDSDPRPRLGGDWQSSEPRTPFQPYPIGGTRTRRY
jgi:hypothetical protein